MFCSCASVPSIDILRRHHWLHPNGKSDYRFLISFFSGIKNTDKPEAQDSSGRTA